MPPWGAIPLPFPLPSLPARLFPVKLSFTLHIPRLTLTASIQCQIQQMHHSP